MPRKLSELAQKGTLLAWCMTPNAKKKGSSLIDVTGAFTTQVDRCNFTIVVPQLSQRYTSGTAQWKTFGSHPISMVIQSVSLGSKKKISEQEKYRLGTILDALWSCAKVHL